MSSADLQAHARIRDAAIRLFGQQGVKSTTIRQIAEAAGVSAALVIHHFGSKDGLRRACDEWMMDRLTASKTAALGGEEAFEWTMRAQAEFQPFYPYIAASVSEGGENAQRLFDAMCRLTRDMFAVGVPAGTLRTPEDLEATITTLVAFSLGATMLESQVARRLGGASMFDGDVLQRYSLATTELFTHGLFADSRMLEQLRAAFGAHLPADGVTDPDPTAHPVTPSPPPPSTPEATP